MNERRKYDRTNLAFFTRVYDRETGRLLGNLANLTDDGFMLIGDEPIDAERNYRIFMELDEAVLKQTHLNFEARCLWRQIDDVSPQFYSAGFQFLQIQPQDLKMVQKIMQQYRLRR